MFDRIRKEIAKRFTRIEVVRSRPMTDDQLLEAFAMDPDHPVLQAILELIDRARWEARESAKATIRSDRETLFALGGEYGLDKFQDYLLNLRANAMAKRGGN
jgi:hypothetical protein